MAQTYFTLPSFARAKKHQQELEATNPTNPLLKDEDERFLERITSQDNESEATTNADQSRIHDDGKEVDTGEKAEQVILPGSQAGDGSDDPPESVIEHKDFASSSPLKRTKKDNFNELPSQEEAEAATRGFSSGTQKAAEGTDKKTWSSYLPSMSLNKKSTSDQKTDSPDESSPKSDKDGRTWAQYASTYVPTTTIPTMSATLPVMPTLPAYWTKSKDSKAEPVLNEDGTVNEEATKEKQEKEVSVLLDNLNLSSINNRVFAFSQESQKLYEQFILVLKDVINGVPTAYDDMEKFLKEAGPAIEKQWNSMPPFVQTLVKSLPAKLGATIAPEVLLASSGKNGSDAKAQAETGDKKQSKKKKRFIRIPGLKSLVKKQGFAATMLRNITVFLKTRFPLLMSLTNVGMSLSVLLLMLVFYYCYKRGRETRIANEAANDDDEVEVELTDEGDDDDAVAGGESAEIEASTVKTG